MADEDRAMGIVTDLSRNLEAFFRHLLPGVFILSAAYAAYPSRLAGLNRSSWEDLAIMGTIAFAIGNIWFAFNRFGVHRFIDYVLLCLANIASGQKSLTVASPLGTLRAMRDVFGTGAAVRSAWSTRRDLLLENF